MLGPSHTRVYATAAVGSGWWLVDALRAHGPGWQLAPPLLFAAASLAGAVRCWIGDRRADEGHRALLASLRRPCPPGQEKLN